MRAMRRCMGKNKVPEKPNESRKDASDPRAPRRPYEKPELRHLGHMAEVTQKSGGNVDGGNPNAKMMP